VAFGRLERTQGPQPMSEINVTPLVDVMLVLVVILIITAPLLASTIRLDLPNTDAGQPSDSQKFVTVSINRQGELFLNDNPLGALQLAQRLKEAAARNPDMEVQLRADQTVPYGRVVEVMGVAHKAGLHRIGFVAEPPKK